MERHDFIIKTMVKTGFRTSLKGFGQFCRCVELFTDEPSPTLESLYTRIAADYRCTKSSVEKNLRQLCISSDASSAIGKLFGIEFVDTGNKEIISMFSKYITLHRDNYNRDNYSRDNYSCDDCNIER